MVKSKNNNKFSEFRQKYPFFSYKGFDYQYTDKGLRIQFHFNLSDRYSFHPTMIIPSKSFMNMDIVTDEMLSNLIFHIGMVEMISYWKAACPPEIRVECGSLSEEQVKWWKKLLYHGLGEFIYLNSIETNMEDFVSIVSKEDAPLKPFSIALKESSIIPIGGGKDSVVTLELLSGKEGNIPMVINPRQATAGTLMKKKYFYDSVFEIRRTLDPLLLELNDQGFLNGHTPFSALIAFTAVLASVLTGTKYIALSNESSANESTIAGSFINHQYSKSVEFEGDFRWYQKKFITADAEYFSFLRPLSELQIASLFSRFPAYFPVFRSCNAGSKTDSWCGKCPKCLFTYIILSPFLEKDQLSNIFGNNLLDDPRLLPVLNELAGISETKPFDCIGTINEVNAVLGYLLQKNGPGEAEFLLREYQNTEAFSHYRHSGIETLLNDYNIENFLPESFKPLLKSALHDRPSQI
jgi:UDP-N-acetyl-alpha-D-muramoyl-L-alanyl-L-glutamate epimerase